MLILLGFHNKVVTFTHLENQIMQNISWWRNKILHELCLPWHQMIVLIKYHKELTNSSGFLHPQINLVLKAYLVPIWVFSNWYATLSLPPVIVIHRLLHTDFHMLSSCLRPMKQ